MKTNLLKLFNYIKEEGIKPIDPNKLSVGNVYVIKKNNTQIFVKFVDMLYKRLTVTNNTKLVFIDNNKNTYIVTYKDNKLTMNGKEIRIYT